MSQRNPPKRIKKAEWSRYGGKENLMEMYEDFYIIFMTDPFMNILFDMEKNEINYKEHAHRFGAWMLQWFGDDDEYSTFRPGHPLSNL